MAVDCFELPEKIRDKFIDERILCKTPPYFREEIHSVVGRLVRNYEGRDCAVLSLLAYAAQNGLLKEIARSLDDYYQSRLKSFSLSARNSKGMNISHMADVFFLDCLNRIKSSKSKMH